MMGVRDIELTRALQNIFEFRKKVKRSLIFVSVNVVLYNFAPRVSTPVLIPLVWQCWQNTSPRIANFLVLARVKLPGVSQYKIFWR